MRKKIKAHEERDVKTTNDEEPSEPMPAYLLDRKKWVFSPSLVPSPSGSSRGVPPEGCRTEEERRC